MRTASQFAEEIKSIAAEISVAPTTEPVTEEIADWRGPLQGIQVDLRRMMHQDIDKFMESAQKIVQRAEESGWSKLVIQNEVARWSGDVNRVYAKFKDATQGFSDMVKAMGIPTRRHSTKGKAPSKGKMDWGKLPQSQLKKEVQVQLKRLSAGIHSLADDGAYMLHQIDRILKYKAPKDETIIEEIGALFQDFVDFRNAFGSKVWGPYHGLLGRLNSIKAPPLKAQGPEYQKTMRKRPMKTMPPTPQFPTSMVASSNLPIDCPELREAIERDRLRASRAILGEDQGNAQGLIEAIEGELLGEEPAFEQASLWDGKEGLGEAWGGGFQSSDEELEYLFGAFDGDPRPKRKKEILQKIFKFMDANNMWSNRHWKKEYQQRKKMVGESEDHAGGMSEAKASEMKAKGYQFKILLKDKPPLYAKTEKGAKEVQKDYPGSKIVANESGEIDDPALVEAAADCDLLSFFEDFDGLLYGEEDELEEALLYEAKRALSVARTIMKALAPAVQKRVLDPKMTDISPTQTNLVAVKDEGGVAVGWQATVQLADDGMVTIDFQNVTQGKPPRKIDDLAPFEPTKMNLVKAASWVEKHAKTIIKEEDERPFDLDEVVSPMKATKMTVDAGPMLKLVKKVRDVAEASKVFMKAISESGMGASELYPYVRPGQKGLGLVYDGRDVIGYFSYNGRIWGMNDKLLYDPGRGMVAESDGTVDYLSEMSEVTKTILDQFGGTRALFMIGGQVYNVDSNTLGIKWPNKKRSKGNYVEIKYVPGKDLYDMEFFNVSIKGKQSVKKHKGVYGDQLADLFEKQTGWYLRM